MVGKKIWAVMKFGFGLFLAGLGLLSIPSITIAIFVTITGLLLCGAGLVDFFRSENAEAYGGYRWDSASDSNGQSNTVNESYHHHNNFDSGSSDSSSGDSFDCHCDCSGDCSSDSGGGDCGCDSGSDSSSSD